MHETQLMHTFVSLFEHLVDNSAFTRVGRTGPTLKDISLAAWERARNSLHIWSETLRNVSN